MNVRPNHNRVELEPAQEQTLDMQILARLDKITDGQEYMRVALFGGKYQEIEHPGQLPQMTKEIDLLRREKELLDGRLKVLEAEREQRKTVIRTAARIAAFEGSVIGALITLAVEFCRRH